jgi:hypothetical protein
MKDLRATPRDLVEIARRIEAERRRVDPPAPPPQPIVSPSIGRRARLVAPIAIASGGVAIFLAGFVSGRTPEPPARARAAIAYVAERIDVAAFEAPEPVAAPMMAPKPAPPTVAEQVAAVLAADALAVEEEPSDDAARATDSGGAATARGDRPNTGGVVDRTTLRAPLDAAERRAAFAARAPDAADVAAVGGPPADVPRLPVAALLEAEALARADALALAAPALAEAAAPPPVEAHPAAESFAVQTNARAAREHAASLVVNACASGRGAAVRREAEALVRSNLGSALAARVRAACFTVTVHRGVARR